jgi:prephenate dehydratase
VETVVSMPMATVHCADSLEANLPDVDVRAANSTTEAAGLVHEGPPRAAADAAAAREHADIRWHEADDWIDGVRGMIG